MKFGEKFGETFEKANAGAQTVLPEFQIDNLAAATYGTRATPQELEFARAIEQAVLQSAGVQAWKKNAERWQFFIDNYDEYGAVGYIDAANFKADIDAAMEKQP